MDASQKKGLLVGCGIPLAIPLGVMLVLAAPNIVAWLSPNPPRPEITYGEFPFRIEYEVYGELMVLEDVVICEFDGFRLSGPNRLRSWKKRLASGAEEAVLLVTNSGTLLYCNTKSAPYYMGEFNGNAGNTQLGAVIRSGSRDRAISNSELYDTYGIRLISWEFSPPIENSYR